MTWKWISILAVLPGYVCLLGVLALIAKWRATRKQKQVLPQRATDTKESFLEYFSAKGIPEDVAEGGFTYLRGLMQVPEFPLRPEDDLIFAGVDRKLEMEDILEDLTEALSVRMLTEDEYESIVRDVGPLWTVEDLIKLLAVHCNRMHRQP